LAVERLFRHAVDGSRRQGKTVERQPEPHILLSLQRAVGNRAVTRLLTVQRGGDPGEASSPPINNPLLSANPMAVFFKHFLNSIELLGRMAEQRNVMGVRTAQTTLALARGQAGQLRGRGEAEAGEAMTDAIDSLAGAAASASSPSQPGGQSESEGATAASPAMLLGQAADSLRSGAEQVTKSAASSVLGGGGGAGLGDIATAMRAIAQQIDQHRADALDSTTWDALAESARAAEAASEFQWQV
jgi:hypothetical protein